MLSLILVNVIMLSFINAMCHYAVMASAVMQNEPTRLTGNRWLLASVSWDTSVQVDIGESMLESAALKR